MCPAPLPLQIRIEIQTTEPVLAQHQARFNSLVQDVMLWRAALADWKARIDRLSDTLEPVYRELDAAWREWASALEQASLQTEFTRAERKQLEEMAREAGSALPAAADDADATGEPTAEDLSQDWERRAAAAAAHREERAAARRAAAASKQRKQATQEVSQSVRDVYRRLASALHPDREQDAQERGRKTALMQHANQAYAEGNLLALLELQLQAEQVDAGHLAGADRRRLQHYVDVLQEQLSQLQAETRRLEAEFRSAVGLPPGAGLQPRKADRLITSEAQRLRGELQLLRRQARLLPDVEATRLWLREQRKRT